MGFINSATTVNVTAVLTNAGKEKLYNSIEGGGNIRFITQFGLGDSDANYAAIDVGTPKLSSGHVPEASEFVPSPRSFALYQGRYRPGFPVLLINGTPGPEVFTTLSIGNNQPTSLQFRITSEWPKNTVIEEGYFPQILYPTNLPSISFRALFAMTNNGNGLYTFTFNGNASDQDLLTLLGASRMGSTTIPIKIGGYNTQQFVTYYIEVTQ